MPRFVETFSSSLAEERGEAEGDRAGSALSLHSEARSKAPKVFKPENVKFATRCGAARPFPSDRPEPSRFPPDP